MTHILVTNDDGITSPGLLALAHALTPLGTVSVLAPDHNWSASGHVKTLHKPLRVRHVHLEDGTPALSSDGAPSDCVALAMLGIIPEKIDLLVSGINAGMNVGHDLTYSGTVTAAMEAVIFGVPAVAVSLDLPEDQTEPCDYTPAARMAERVARQVLAHGLPKDTLLNLNVPCLPYEKIRGVHITRQGLRVYRDELVRRLDPRGKPYYWIGGPPPTGVSEEGSDFWALSQGYASVTPVHLDLTAHEFMDALAKWKWEE
jgi:5'/3'-nucleotidase